MFPMTWKSTTSTGIGATTADAISGFAHTNRICEIVAPTEQTGLDIGASTNKAIDTMHILG
jgi:hypothetical protein